MSKVNHNLLLLATCFASCLEVGLEVSNDFPQFNDQRSVRLHFIAQPQFLRLEIVIALRFLTQQLLQVLNLTRATNSSHTAAITQCQSTAFSFQQISEMPRNISKYKNATHIQPDYTSDKWFSH